MENGDLNETHYDFGSFIWLHHHFEMCTVQSCHSLLKWMTMQIVSWERILEYNFHSQERSREIHYTCIEAFELYEIEIK